MVKRLVINIIKTDYIDIKIKLSKLNVAGSKPVADTYTKKKETTVKKFQSRLDYLKGFICNCDLIMKFKIEFGMNTCLLKKNYTFKVFTN